MIKVCHMTSVHIRTDTRIFYKECHSLKRNGYDITLVATGESEVLDGIPIVGVPKAKNRLSRILFTARGVYKAARKLDADIYHFHDPELLPYGKKLKKQGKIVIYDSHEDVPRQILSKPWIPRLLRPIVSRVFEIRENHIARRLSGVIAATPYIAQRFSYIHHHVIDINNYPILESIEPGDTSFRERKPQLCYTGLISKIRGSDAMFEAIGQTEGTLLIAGPDDTGRFQEGFTPPDHTKYLGILTKKQVADLYKQCVGGIVLYLPEPNHVNAQPNKLFEYMSAGLPLIASDFPLWKTLVEGNHCGLCVNPADSHSAAQAIRHLLENLDEAQQMGENGRKAVLERYNWGMEEKKLLDYYAMLLGKQA